MENTFSHVIKKRDHLKFFVKKLTFLFLRLKQEIGLYEGLQRNSSKMLRVVYSGDATRGKYFIERLFGYVPKRRIIGRRFTWSVPRSFQLAGERGDLLFVESNRLFAKQFRKAGFFVVPEWVEFGRKVIPGPVKRYPGAPRSLKSDLNKIRNANFEYVLSNDPNDFFRFYTKMYLPHIKKMFGSSKIVKSEKILKKAFEAGFLFLLVHERSSIAGAIVREDKDIIIETTFGVLDGSEDYLRMGVSGAIDYHLIDWAAKNHKSFLNVGHTRPFPVDGVYHNKRKWFMSIIPDRDGVMDMGIKIWRWDGEMAEALKDYPFVFQRQDGLGLFCIYNGSEKAGAKQVEALYRKFAVRGLRDLVILSAAGFRNEPFDIPTDIRGLNVRLFTSVGQMMAWQNGKGFA